MIQKFEADIPDGTHMGQAKGDVDMQRGMLFNDKGELVGQAKFRKVEETPGNYEDNAGLDLDRLGASVATAISAISIFANRKSMEASAPTRDAQREYEIELKNQELDQQREEAAIEDIRIQNRLAYQREEIELEEERQQNELEYEAQQLMLEKIKHEEQRRMRFENLMDDLEEEYLRADEDEEYEVVVVEEELDPEGYLGFVDVVLANCQKGVSSKEAQGQLLEVIEMSRNLALKIKQYAQTCINHGETVPDNYYAWQKAIEKLVTGKVIESLQTISSLDELSIEQKQTYCSLLGQGQSNLEHEGMRQQLNEEKLGEYLFVEPANYSQPAEIAYCPNCGNEVNVNQAFCINCGASLR